MLAAIAVLLSIVALVAALTSGTTSGGTTSGGTANGAAPAETAASASPTCDATAVAAKTMASVVTLFVRGTDGSASNGSGEFLDAEGNILTNNHVISAAVGGGTITVLRPNGEELSAALVGRDPQTDLAVVKVTPVAAVHPITFGSAPSIGAQVFAIGAPLGLSETFTSGVVSGLGRSVRVPSDGGTTALLVSAIQTDAAINPGNSGGMLADCVGDLVGVPTAGATANDSLGHPVAGSIGLGFAVPAETARRVGTELIASGKVVHGDFGLAVVPVLGPASSLNPSGLYVTSVTPGGAAAAAGLRRSDIITGIDGQPVTGADQLQEISLSNPPGATITLQFQRAGETHSADVVLH